MKRNKKEINIILILLMFIIVFETIIFKIIPQYIDLISFGLLFVLLIYLIAKWGIRKDKSYYKITTTKIVIISLMMYILIIYLLGLITGFEKNVFSLKFVKVLKNILPVILNIVCSDLIRYIILKREPSKGQTIILTILFILLNTIIMVNNMILKSPSQIFSMVSVVLLPCIARECLYTYITEKVGLLPTLILHLCMELYVYVVPITPALGNYISSIFGILLPFAIYKQVYKCVSYKEKYSLYAKNYVRRFFFILTAGLAGVLIVFVSGLTKYHLIAIGSDSMNPIYYYGDAVLYEKIDPKVVKVDDILVFQINGEIITHRVVKIEREKGMLKYTTKGDNNDIVDNLDVYEKNVLGVVRLVVKYIGYPTVKLSETLGG